MKMLRQSIESNDIDRHSQKFQQFVPDRSDVKQRSLGGCVDQNIQIARLRVVAVGDGTEDTGIARTIRFNNMSDCSAMRMQGNGRFHFGFLSRVAV